MSLSSFLRRLLRGPVARLVLALVVFAGSIGALVATSFADQWFNGGVTWGKPQIDVPLADVNPMGINLFLEKEVERDKITRSLQLARDAGFKWVRQVFAWNDIEITAKGNYTDTRNPGVEVSAWDKYDFIVQQCRLYGMEILARLDSPPKWARIPSDNTDEFHKGPPEHNEDFGDFAYAVASRYKGQIGYFQVWNEPNLFGEWGGHPVSAAEYTELLKVAYRRIKEASPQAVVVSAALAPTAENTFANLNDILYLEDMYRAGAAPYFDVFSTMLYGLGQSPEDRRTDLNRLSFSRPVLVRNVMDRFGDSRKPVWISEYSWLSLPDALASDPLLAEPPPVGRNIWGRTVSEEQQGRYLVEGYERARSEWPWMGVMFVWHLRNPDGDPREPATYFSILNGDFSPRPAYNALKAYSSRVPAQPQTIDKPLWNALGFPILYLLFAAIGALSGALGVSRLGIWASAALNRPAAAYSAVVRRRARDAAAVAGLAAFFGLYLFAENIPMVGLGLTGCFAIALFKPQTALAAVALAAPFFWYPKVYGNQHFPAAETLLLVVFAAVLARRLLVWLMPRLAVRLGLLEGQLTSGAISGDMSSAGASRSSSRLGARFLEWNREDAFAAPAVLLLIAGTLSLAFLANSEYARDSARAYRWVIVEPVLFYFLITDAVSSRRGALRILDFFVAGGVVVAFVGLWQVITGNGTLDVEGVSRVVSVYRHPNNLALYLERVLPVVAVGTLFLPRGPRKLAYGLATVPLGLAFVLTFSRGAWAAVAVALVVGVVVARRHRPAGARSLLSGVGRRRFAAVGATVVGLGVLGALVLVPRLPERVFSAGSGLLRVTIWDSAIRMALDHPVVGVGPDQFLNQFRLKYGPEPCRSDASTSPEGAATDAFSECYTAHPHNIFLDYWLNLGIMGLLVLLWLLWRYFREALYIAKQTAAGRCVDPAARALAAGLAAVMAGFLVHGLVDNSYFLMDLALVFWLCCALVQLLRTNALSAD